MILLFLLFCSYTEIKAQDTLEIKEISIYESRFSAFSFTDPQEIRGLNQAFKKFLRLEDVLNDHSTTSIKTYGGVGNIACASFRGTPSNQLLVVWNGFPVNSISTGMSDLSLFQISAFDEVKIIPGANSSLFGSGTAGGAIELNNNFLSDHKIEITTGLETGSFNLRQYMSEIKINGFKVDYRLSLECLNAENNFKFIDRYKIGLPKESRTNNAVAAYSLNQSLKLKLSEKQNIESGLLYHLKYKEIPTIAGSYSNGNQNQTDSIFKCFIRWNHFVKHGKFSIGSAFFRDYLRYTDKKLPDDSCYLIYSEITSKSILTDISFQYAFKTFDFNISGLFSNSYALTENYKKLRISENSFAVFSAMKYRFKHTSFILNFRYEFKVQTFPIVSLSLKRNVFGNKTQMVFNLSNSFRKPSFNENYWQPGGNPDLKNESGIYSDLIWKQKILNSRVLVLNVSQTFYYSNINDLIQWSPVNGVWTPENLNQVKTRGVDLNLNMDYVKHYLDVSSNLIYLFTSSEMIGETFNHQMGYVPIHSAKLNLDFKYKKFSFGNTLRYTGSRYTTADNNPEYILDPYFLMNMYVGFEFKFKSICLPIVIKCMNVTNTNYEDIRAFPAPGRTFFLNVLIQFIK